jgi:2-dehydro-3-deoxyphosphogluconate aldolase/(4S)-4-hydroxy-2-oxoglutarate aldolase
MQNLVKKHKIVSILRNIPLDKTMDYVNACYEGGIRILEVALNSTHGLEQISMIKDKYGDDLIVGAGTAVTVPLAKEAVKVGAAFLLTPSSNEKVLAFCQENKINIIPGVMTPTDVDICTSYGFTTLKLFPAGDLPPKYINSLKGPFDKTEYIAVGGVKANNINSFFENGFIGVGIGGGLIPAEYIKENNWQEASKYISNIVKSIKC